MSQLGWISTAAWLVVVIVGALFRSRTYAIFRGVTLGLHTLIAVPLLPYAGSLLPLALYLHAAVYLDSLLLVRPKLRPVWFRLLLSWPAQFMAASTFLAFPWSIAAAFHLEPWGLFLPYLIGFMGLLQSLTSRVETKEIVVGEVEELPRVARVPQSAASPSTPEQTAPSLRVAQITDPHLGPFMSVSRLAKICARVEEAQPDLVFLTGDFLTMESQADANCLADALAPLAQLRGRVFACLGNHDHEAPQTVTRALERVGAQLLVDDAIIVETRAGLVQLLGFDFHFRTRKELMDRVIKSHPRLPGTLRLALLHDPGAFKHLPPGEVDLAFSGHTHGGQVGLVSFGLRWTLVSAIAKLPDHGLWGHGRSRLYVHRGTGHYGFPLRLGVPSEESILTLHHSK